MRQDFMHDDCCTENRSGCRPPPLAIGEIAQRMFQKFLQLADWGAVATIAVLSLVPGDLRPHTEAPGYLEHVAAYFITAILLSLGYLRWSPIVIIAPLSIYAASLEIAQLYIPGRNSSVWDWFAGSSGALMGVVVATFVLRLWRRSPDTNWRS